jgi:hypothetical protein
MFIQFFFPVVAGENDDFREREMEEIKKKEIDFE